MCHFAQTSTTHAAPAMLRRRCTKSCCSWRGLVFGVPAPIAMTVAMAMLLGTMRWSWKIGRLAGINTYVHASFLFLVAWAAWAAYQGAGSALAAMLGVLFLLAVFGSVLLHELGHALAARHYGINTRQITLLPIGGLAQLEGEPRTPAQEFVIAGAGPAVNFAIAAVLFVVTSVLGLSSYGLLASLLYANLTLGIFNLVPAFPMDGGRILRAALAMRMGGPRATRVAAKIGAFAAIAFGIYAVVTGAWMMVLVAGFVWFAATAEGRRSDGVYRGTRFGGPATQAWDSSRAWSREADRSSSGWSSPRILIVSVRRFLR